MKTNKILLLALPLLLAATACDNSGSKRNQSELSSVTSESQSESQPTPSSRSEEEELPEKTPEELEQEARESFNYFSNVLANGDFVVQIESDSIIAPMHNRTYVADGVYVTFSYAEDEDYYQDTDTYVSIEHGYLANKDGVLRLRADYVNNYNNAKPVGFALKSTYEEAKQFVNSKQVRLPFNINDWEYIGNVNGVASFKTTSNAVARIYNLYETASLATYDYETIYASFSSDGKLLFLTADGFGDSESLIIIRDLELDQSRSKVTRGDDYDEFYERRFIRNLIDTYKDYDFSKTSWDETYNNIFSSDVAPFPTDGDQYYFIDKLSTNTYSNHLVNKIGFINTGDISANYRTQLEDFGYEAVAGETSLFQKIVDGYNIRLSISYEAATTNYPSGIFYITTIVQ